jgi:intraflagellar transport protein 140
LLALKEALKYVVKAKQAPGKTEKLNSLDQRIRLVERFVEARKCAKTDSAEMIKICNQLLDQVDIESAIRVGDVFALLIEYFYAQNSSNGFQQAYNLLERMQDRNIVIAPYLDQAIIDRVYAAVGVAQQQPVQQPNRHQDEINDEIEEDM